MPRVNGPIAASDGVDRAVTGRAVSERAVSERAVTERVGAQVAAARRRAGLTLAAVAEREGVSPAHLSQIESGLANPTVRTLAQVARALDADVATLFGAASPVATAGFAARVAPLPLAAEAGGPPAVFDLTAPGAERLAVRLLHGDAGDHADLVLHDGEEIVTVLRGSATLDLDGDRRALRAGSVAHLPAGVPHRLEPGPDFVASVVFTA